MKLHDIRERFKTVRAQTLALAEPLEPDDWIPQSMPDCSPTKWHLGHTTWFWEEFVLKPHFPNYQSFASNLGLVFNSYYVGAGPRFAQSARQQIVRPTADKVRQYREYVDRHMVKLFDLISDVPDSEAHLLLLGIAHEEQHQELIVTDLKHLYAGNPFEPSYIGLKPDNAREATSSLVTHVYDSGVRTCGYDGGGFCFDNEQPQHEVHLRAFSLSPTLVTNREYQAFIADGGYSRPTLWLDEGYSWVQKESWRAPLYWSLKGQTWGYYTLSGHRPLNLNEPVCHVSFYEADAYARWKGTRLPTEFEWEYVAKKQGRIEGQFLESNLFHPQPIEFQDGVINDLYGKVWQWTESSYRPYPGYRIPQGTLGEYNGKFMMNQVVLRGGSCATPRNHIRPTYRNFFPPHARWQFSGIRLAWDV